MRKLADRDLALDRTMIPLGSCTMKLNATAEMLFLTWPEFAELHPFAPGDQADGYRDMFADLSTKLCAITASTPFFSSRTRGLRASMRACLRSAPIIAAEMKRIVRSV